MRPDRALGAGDLVAQVHAAAERPADLELADRAALEPDQGDRVVLGLDRMHQRVGPAHHLDGPVALADVAADDLDAVAAEVDDRAAAGLLARPRTRRCAGRVRLAASAPTCTSPIAPALHRRDRLQRLRRVDEVLEVAAEDAGAARRCRGSASPRRRCGRAAWCRARPCRRRPRARPPPRAGGSAARSTTVSVSGCVDRLPRGRVDVAARPSSRANASRALARCASRRPRRGRGCAGRAASWCRRRRSGPFRASTPCGRSRLRSRSFLDG